MRAPALTGLVAITALVLAAAWTVAVREAPETEISQPLLYPALVDRANDITGIRIRSAGQLTELERRGETWVVANVGGYPALVENVKRLVVNVADLRVIEGKTRRPELYYRLQVEDLADEEARSREVVMHDAEGREVASLLIGKDRSSSIVGDNDALYVRRGGEEQALLVAGALPVTARPSDWMDDTIADLDADRVRSIEIRHADGERLRIERDDPAVKDYRLATLPEGARVKSVALLTSLATALSELRFDGVMARDLAGLPAEPAVVSEFRSFDGLVARVRLYESGDRRLALLEADTEPGAEPAVVEEARAWNARSADWAYELPGFKLNMVAKRQGDLVAGQAPFSLPGQR